MMLTTDSLYVRFPTEENWLPNKKRSRVVCQCACHNQTDPVRSRVRTSAPAHSALKVVS
jgi:hypothetical protein